MLASAGRGILVASRRVGQQQYVAPSCQVLCRYYSTPDGKDGGGRKGGVVQNILRS